MFSPPFSPLSCSRPVLSGAHCFPASSPSVLLMVTRGSVLEHAHDGGKGRPRLEHPECFWRDEAPLFLLSRARIWWLAMARAWESVESYERDHGYAFDAACGSPRERTGRTISSPCSTSMCRSAAASGLPFGPTARVETGPETASSTSLSNYCPTDSLILAQALMTLPRQSDTGTTRSPRSLSTPLRTASTAASSLPRRSTNPAALTSPM